MNENTKSNRISQHINVNTRTVKSNSPKFEHREVYGFAGKKPTTNSILPRENAFNLEDWLKNINKKIDKIFENLTDTITNDVQEISLCIRRFVRFYVRFLMLCALIAFGYVFLIPFIESNPSILENVPNITNLLQSMKVLAGYATDFLHWNFVWANRIIENIIKEVSALIS